MLFSVVLSLAALAVAAPAEIKARANTVCGKTTYYDSDVSDAANAACQYVQSGGTAGSSTYPHKYNDYEGFGFNGVQAPYYEFPILSSFKVYTGGSPGPDRVVINDNCDLAGVITHTGASGNNFVGCSGTS